ncbi:MAG: hypothetical protein IJ774_03865 [Selenomonadaceae bacterium]|nr:hypothetical protein [Selenomonadaceae bacterium]
MLDGQQRTLSICQYVRGEPIRQDYLETVLKWIADRDGLKYVDSRGARRLSRNIVAKCAACLGA